MGAGASAAALRALEATADGDLEEALAGFTPEGRARLRQALRGAEGTEVEAAATSSPAQVTGGTTSAAPAGSEVAASGGATAGDAQALRVLSPGQAAAAEAALAAFREQTPPSTALSHHPPSSLHFSRELRKPWNIILDMLEHTTLVDARYLIALAKAGGVVPRWQDLPEEAKLGVHNHWRMSIGCGQYRYRIVALSYPWLDWFHPDRCGEQLARIAPILQKFLDEPGCHSELDNCPLTVGVLWDWASLPQRPYGSNDEEKRFKMGLQCINQWYRHPYVPVLTVTWDPPTGVAYGNTRAYAARGWCFFESSIAQIVKEESCLWDAALAEGDWSLQTLKKSRCPPLPPDVFAKRMASGISSGELKFTAGADQAMVTEQYNIGFIDAFSGYSSLAVTTDIYFYGFGWDDDDAKELANAVAYVNTNCDLPTPLCICVDIGHKYSNIGRDALHRVSLDAYDRNKHAPEHPPGPRAPGPKQVYVWTSDLPGDRR